MYSPRIAELTQLFDVILALHTQALRYPHSLRSDAGICHELSQRLLISDSVQNHVRVWMEQWPQGTRDPLYPIKKPWWYFWGNHASYFGRNGMWYGSQGTQRRELLLYMLDRCNKTITTLEKLK